MAATVVVSRCGVSQSVPTHPFRLRDAAATTCLIGCPAMLSRFPGNRFAVGSSVRTQTFKLPSCMYGAVSLIGAVLMVMLLWACVLPALAAAEEPPSLQAAFVGTFSDEYTY